jgi:hypothetical protein
LPWASPCAAHPKVACPVTRHDYGVRVPGLLPPALFSITNRGDAPLVLNPQPCCGIVVLGAQPPIPPGATRRVTIRAMHLHEGLLRKTVHVLTNDPGAPEIQFQLIAVGRSPVVLFPDDELTMPLNPRATEEQRVTLHCNDQPVLKITSIRCSAPYVHCREIAPLVAAGKEGGPDRAVMVSVTPDAPATPYQAVVALGTNCPRDPEVKLHVYGVSSDAVTAQPPRIEFDPIDARQLVADQIVVLSRTAGPFKVLDVTTSDPRMQTRVMTDPSGVIEELLASFSPGKQRGPFQGTITVRTDDPQRPRLVIPYAGEAH